jgi:hypothetical protein
MRPANHWLWRGSKAGSDGVLAAGSVTGRVLAAESNMSGWMHPSPAQPHDRPFIAYAMHHVAQ